MIHLTEGPFTKGGHNPPMRDDEPRPAPPMGSGGQPPEAFIYNSTWGIQKKLKPELVAEIREYLVAEWPKMKDEFGDLHDVLIAFRRKSDGRRLMINQLEPIFTYVARNGGVWPQPS